MTIVSKLQMSETEQEIIRTLELLCEPGSVVEVRIPAGNRIKSGYYNDFYKLASDVSRINGKETIYITANPVDSALLARSANKLKDYAKNTTCDNDIIKRRWFLIDCDFKRPAGISASEVEHKAALERTQQVRNWLRERGWPEGLFADSGNGGHALYRIDLPNDDKSRVLIDKCLKALDFLFSDGDSGVVIDTTVYNAARIWKLYGTVSCKGDNIPERPHRKSRLLDVPNNIDIVTIEQLQKLADFFPEQPKSQPKQHHGGTEFDIEEWLHKYQLPVKRQKNWNNGGRVWIINPCPWDSNHTDDSAYIVQFSNGAIAAGCHHNGCRDKNWHELREMYEPERHERVIKTQHKDKPVELNKENIVTKVETFNLTDLGNAERLVFHHGMDLKYCHTWNKWLVWNGERWEIDETREVERKAASTVRMIYHEAGEDESKEQRKAIAKWARVSESNNRIKAMLELAKSMEEIPIKPDDIDQDGWMLNVKNGTIDLRTGQLLNHNRAHLISKLSPIYYDHEAQCPTWLEFLNKIMDSKTEVITFLQKAIGYSLTGDTSEQCMFILHGSGANGKSTFLETIAAMLGEGGYAKQAPAKSFMVKSSDSVPNDIAMLKGARFVTASEAEEGQRFSEALIKQMTGGERLTARFMRADFFTFQPEFKLFLGTNHRPVIKGTDHGIWRRIRLIPFTVKIPPEQQDKELPLKLKAELPGILAWAVRGCLTWQQEGLGMPEEVKAAIQGYKTEMDTIEGFINECCIVTDHAQIQAGKLYESYKKWCNENGEEPQTQRRFGSVLSERGFISKRGTAGRHTWKGIGLMDIPSLWAKGS